MRKLLCVIVVLLPLSTVQGAYVVRISDLQFSPTPPNPIRVAGRVMSVSPLKLNDGSGEITVVGTEAALSDYLVVTGDWDGSVLTVAGAVDQVIPPAVCDMVHIPAGSFLMGNSGAEGYTPCYELPQHSVYLSGYWIGKYEVTRGEYRKFLESTGRATPAYWAAEQTWKSGQTFTQTEDHPVVGVTWYDADAYCRWAGGHLPTEAEWEKAARWTGSYPNVYPWGNVWDAEKCNNYYDHNPAGGGYGRSQTSPVGSYPAGASPYGCQDMAGNVWEWCADWYKSYPGCSCLFDYTYSYRVLRGGSWNYSVGDSFRCANRSSYYTFSGFWNNSGFRLAR